MFMMKGILVLFVSLAIGYVLCILAEKQKGTLRTVGYTLGIAIIALALLYGAAESISESSMTDKSICTCKAMKGQLYQAHVRARHK